MSDPVPAATGPVFGQIRARQSYRWGDRRLAPGDTVMDLRCPGGAADFATFKSALRWSAFEVVQLDAPAPAPAATPAPTVENPPPNLRDLAVQLSGIGPDQLAAIPGMSKAVLAKLQGWAAEHLAATAGTPA